MGRYFWPSVAISLALVALALVVRYGRKWVLGPIRLHRISRYPLRAEFRPMRDEELTPEIRKLLATILPRFAAEGFQVAANIGMTDPPKRAWAVQALLVNRDTNDVAVSIVAAAQSKASVAVAVRSEFADGTQVVTGATRGDPSTLPRNPAIDSLGFSWVRDPRVLCEIHRRRLGHLGFGNRPRVAPPPGAELSYMDAERERDFAFWERVGYYHRHEAAGAMRLTWKGAFLSAWKMTEPVKSWRIWLRDGKACRAWRKLGMDGWRPPAVRAAPTPATLGPPQHDGDHSAQPDGRE